MGIFNIFSKKATNNEQAQGAASPSAIDHLPEAGTIFFNSMVELGCQPERMENGDIWVKFQGETLIAQPWERMVDVMDPSWSCIPADDPNLPIFFEAINKVTFRFSGLSILLSCPQEDGNRYIHTRIRFMLHPACPDNTIYISAGLCHLFGIKDSLRESYNELLAQRQAASEQGKRPVGFAPSAAAPEHEAAPESSQE